MKKKFDAILRMREITRLTGLSKSTIYRRMADGSFPSAIQLTAKSIGWHESDIKEWQTNLVIKYPRNLDKQLSEVNNEH